MTYTLKTSKDGKSSTEEFETARQAVEKLEHVRGSGVAKVVIDTITEEPVELTKSESLIIHAEGRHAAENGSGPRACPYIKDGSRLAIWMEGYEAERQPGA